MYANVTNLILFIIIAKFRGSTPAFAYSPECLEHERAEVYT